MQYADKNVRFNPFYLPYKSLLLGTEYALKHRNFQMFGLKLTLSGPNLPLSS